MHLLSIQELSKKTIIEILDNAQRMHDLNIFPDIKKPIINIFLEPSTRTILSFKRSQHLLNMESYDFDILNSSLQKGESLFDTVLNLKSIGINNFVIRSKEESYWEKLLNIEGINIINAGDGMKNHPSQALLDALTIRQHFQTLENLKILVCGDTKHSRVFSSLRELFIKFDSKVDSIGPNNFAEDDIDIKSVIRDYDVVIMLRVQHERHNSNFNTHNYNSEYGLNNESVSLMKETSIFLHPGPVNENVEIIENITYNSNKSKILAQAKNGVFIRAAILEYACKNS